MSQFCLVAYIKNLQYVNTGSLIHKQTKTLLSW